MALTGKPIIDTPPLGHEGTLREKEWNTAAPPAFSALSFLAGSLAGAIGTLVGNPLDTIKVRAQTGEASATTIRALFRGMSGPLLTSGGIQAVNLGMYENFRRRIQMIRGCPADEAAPIHIVGAAGALAGMTISLLTCPQQCVKVLQQSGYKNTWVGCARTLGLRGLFVGFPIQVWKESPRGIYMITYVGLLRKITPEYATDSSVRPPTLARMIAGMAAGTLGWFIIYPADAVKSVMQADFPGHRKYQSPYHCMTSLLREGGVPRLYRDLGATLLRAGPVSGVLMPTFDISLAILRDLFPFLS